MTNASSSPDDLGPILLRLLRARPPRTVIVPGADVFPPCETTATLMVVGKTRGALGGSLYAREIPGSPGRVPHGRPKAAQRSAAFVGRLIAKRLLCAAQPVGRGGIGCALADLAMISDVRVHADVNPVRIFGDDGRPGVANFLFSEEPGRFVVAFPDANERQIDSIARDMGATDDCLLTGSIASNAHAQQENWPAPAFTLWSSAEKICVALELDDLRNSASST
jgi:phosphoribosylformylglycinamidine (FGAM) synthase-like enzyme